MSEPTAIKLPSILDALTYDKVYRPEVLELLLSKLEDRGDTDIASTLLQLQLSNSAELHEVATQQFHELHSLKAHANRRHIETEIALRHSQNNHAQAKAQQRQGIAGVEARARQLLAEAESNYANAKQYEEDILKKETELIAIRKSESIRQAFLRSQLNRFQFH